MGGGDKNKEDPMATPDSSLILETLSEYLKIPVSSSEVTVMAKVTALAQPNEDRRAPVTICAAIDRRWAILY